MATLTEDKNRLTRNNSKGFFPDSLPLASGVELFTGALIGKNAAGYAVEASPTVQFVGVNFGYVKNASATAVDEVQRCAIEVGHIEEIAISAVSTGNIDQPVYALNDGTVAITGSAPHCVGKIIDIVGTTAVRALIDPSYNV